MNPYRIIVHKIRKWLKIERGVRERERMRERERETEREREREGVMVKEILLSNFSSYKMPEGKKIF